MGTICSAERNRANSDEEGEGTTSKKNYATSTSFDSTKGLTPKSTPPPPTNTPPAFKSQKKYLFPTESLSSAAMPDIEDVDSSPITQEQINTLVNLGVSEEIAYEMLEITCGDLDFAMTMIEEGAAVQQEHESDLDHESESAIELPEGALSSEFDAEDYTPKPLHTIAHCPAPKSDEFDYEMDFEPPSYGFTIEGGRQDKNAIVGACLTPRTQMNIIRGSLIVAVASEPVVSLSLDQIRDKMLAAMKEDGIKKVAIRFRAKDELLRKFRLKGCLRIMIQNAEALPGKATHVRIVANKITLSTNRIIPTKNPVWNQGVKFLNFHPYRCGPTSCWVAVANHHVTGSTDIGYAFFKPPMEYNRVTNQVLHLKKKDDVKGVLVVKVLLSKPFHELAQRQLRGVLPHRNSVHRNPKSQQHIQTQNQYQGQHHGYAQAQGQRYYVSQAHRPNRNANAAQYGL